MNRKQKTNWWIDIALLLSFLSTFFLNLTGLILHQWIGILSVLIAAFHLFLHRDWVISVFKRIFRKRSGKARLYFAIDMTIMIGFILIGLTGLVMSSWLNLPLPNYDAWRQLHITVSIASLVLLLVKLALHLSWFERMIRKMIPDSVLTAAKSVPVRVTNDNPKRMGRREFLLTMGVLSSASLIALASASKSLAESITNADVVQADPNPTQTGERYRSHIPKHRNHRPGC